MQRELEDVDPVPADVSASVVNKLNTDTVQIENLLRKITKVLDPCFHKDLHDDRNLLLNTVDIPLTNNGNVSPNSNACFHLFKLYEILYQRSLSVHAADEISMVTETIPWRSSFGASTLVEQQETLFSYRHRNKERRFGCSRTLRCG